MIELEKVCDENLSYYIEYYKAFETDLKQYQSRIYPSKDVDFLSWYHIKCDENYIGAVWLERNCNDDFAVLGIFVVNDKFRNKGIGTEAIKQIIENDLKHLQINKVLLRVREENERAIKCYIKAGFTETQRYKNNGLNVIEMIYEENL